MIRPTRRRWTPSGFTIIRVRSPSPARPVETQRTHMRNSANICSLQRKVQMLNRSCPHAEYTHVRAFVYFVSCSCAQNNWNTIWEQMNECVRSIRLHTHVIDTQGNSVYCHYISRMNVPKKKSKVRLYFCTLSMTLSAHRFWTVYANRRSVFPSLMHIMVTIFCASNLVPVHDPMRLSNKYIFAKWTDSFGAN